MYIYSLLQLHVDHANQIWGGVGPVAQVHSNVLLELTLLAHVNLPKVTAAPIISATLTIFSHYTLFFL